MLLMWDEFRFAKLFLHLNVESTCLFCKFAVGNQPHHFREFVVKYDAVQSKI